VSAQPGGAPERPPLSTRLPERFWVRLDWAAAAVCAVLVYAAVLPGSRLYSLPPVLQLPGRWIPPVLALGLALPVVIRRTDPVRAFILVLAGSTVVLALGGQISHGPVFPLVLVLFTVAATRPRAVAIIALACSLALMVAQGIVLSLAGLGSGPATGTALILIIAWMTGFTVLQRRSYAARVREQIASAAVTEERLRIARELHDVVAHSMTVVAVQAGFSEYVFDQNPGEARAALGAIQRVTREALADMQRLLGVLRQSEAGQAEASQDGTSQDGASQDGASQDGASQDGASQDGASLPRTGPNGTARDAPLQLAPAPGLADLDRLVATTAGAGVRVELASAADRPGIPAAIDQSAFRIVQEALTNVVKHSGADSCRVTIGCHGGDLCVEITDPGGAGRLAVPANGNGRPAGTGHGLIGMRERVSLCGGEFSAAPLPGQGFRVAARFPLTGAAR
jgi:signal transduction histidine kinase